VQTVFNWTWTLNCTHSLTLVATDINRVRVFLRLQKLCCFIYTKRSPNLRLQSTNCDVLILYTCFSWYSAYCWLILFNWIFCELFLWWWIRALADHRLTRGQRSRRPVWVIFRVRASPDEVGDGTVSWAPEQRGVKMGRPRGRNGLVKPASVTQLASGHVD